MFFRGRCLVKERKERDEVASEVEIEERAVGLEDEGGRGRGRVRGSASS